MTAELQLTNREREILALIANGITNTAISKELNISKYTVETHRKNIRNKLGAVNTATLIVIAKDMGLI